MSNNTSESNVVIKEDLKVLEERIFFYENSKKIGTVDKMIPRAVKENEAIKHLLAEREQKDKRIQELEEENSKYKSIDFLFKVQSDANYVNMKKIYFEWLDSIPKQAVIDKIEELKNQISIDICIENNLKKHYELKYKIDVLQELLEGEK